MVSRRFERDNEQEIGWDQPSREQVQKGLQTAYARVVWYSDLEDNYHLCLNCPNYRRIRRRNIRVALENDIPNINEDRTQSDQLTMCKTWENGQDRDICTYVTLNISR